MIAEGVVRIGVVAVLLATGLLGWHERRPSTFLSATAVPDASVRRPSGPVPATQIGMNLGNPSYWSAEWSFDDLVRTSGTLQFLTPEGRWAGIAGNVELDTTGHPINVADGTRLIAILQMGALRLRAGEYRCRVSPGWDVRPFGDWSLRGAGTSFGMTIPSAIPKNGVAIILTARGGRSELRELACTAASSPPGQLFNPAFIADIEPFSVLRFMDWMKTNNAPYREWALRSVPAAFSQAGDRGVAIEYMVAVANQTSADPWFNMPLDADENYYRSFAIYVRDHLAPERQVYVELSNEVWNTSFSQGKDAMRRGQQRYPAATPQQASDYYYGDRVREIMSIWTQVFKGSENRVVRVLASQAVNPNRPEQVLAHADTWRSVDALATAAYFGTNGKDFVGNGAARVDAIFARGSQTVDEAIGHAKAAKAVASKYGLRYVSYEGGPDYAAYRADLRADLLAVNRDPRMFDLYTTFLERWKNEVGDLIMLFDAVSTPGTGGTFGHKDYTGQPLSDAPKMRAVVTAARAYKAKGALPSGRATVASKAGS